MLAMTHFWCSRMIPDVVSSSNSVLQNGLQLTPTKGQHLSTCLEIHAFPMPIRPIKALTLDTLSKSTTCLKLQVWEGSRWITICLFNVAMENDHVEVNHQNHPFFRPMFHSKLVSPHTRRGHPNVCNVESGGPTHPNLTECNCFPGNFGPVPCRKSGALHSSQGGWRSVDDFSMILGLR